VGFSPETADGDGVKKMARQHSKVAAELRWPGRVLTSPAARGEDGGGEARSKRCGRRGRDGTHLGGGDDVVECSAAHS
jgi:hypothetical protein